MKYLLDTHAWIWWHMRPDRLSLSARDAISDRDADTELLLSAISPWEFCKLLERRRLGISCDPETWLAEALEMPRLRLVPLSPHIAYRSTVLPAGFHSDPADQIIVATARDENAVLITRDERIRAYGQVRSLW